MDGRAGRYARQTALEPIGEAGQARLASSQIVVVGCGALGNVVASLMARAGVGRLTLIDRDLVEWSNLQRQLLFDEEHASVGAPKAVAAAEQLRRANSDIEIVAVVRDLDADNAEMLLAGADLILDGTDNFETRYLINEAAVKAGCPWVYAGAVATYGVVLPVIPGETPCLRCVFPSMSVAGGETCDTVGVLGPLIAAIGGIAAAEGLKILLGATGTIRRGLTWMDLWHNSSQLTQLEKPVANCPVCQAGSFELLERGRSALTTRLCGDGAVQVRPLTGAPIDLDDLAGRLSIHGSVRKFDYLVRATIDGYELSVFEDARAIIKGVDDPALARSVYARYIGM
jgi:adenylyltransferase/sulfurtransferase